MSEGGPLILLEERLEPTWGGIDRLSIEVGDAKTDYDRACRLKGYLGVIPVPGGVAVLLTAPYDTSVHRAPSGALMVVQIECAPPDFDDKFDQVVAGVDETMFDRPYSTTQITFRSAALSMFDSAEPGGLATKERVLFAISPGTYRIATQEYEPDPETSLVLHRLELVP